jgi:integrase
MATGKITVASLAKLEGWIWDTSVNGLGARKQTKGVFYYLRYRHNGSQIMKSIGRHGSPWTPDTARNRARELLGTLASGTDPFAQSLKSEGFAAEVEIYLDRKRASLRAGSFNEISRYLRQYSAPLHRMKLDEIDRRILAVLLGQIEQKRGPVARNRVRSALSTFFGWCVTEGLLNINPVEGTAKVSEGGSRERVLGQDELRQLWAALGTSGFDDIVRLLLLTCQRRNEIGALQWGEVDLARKLIVLSPDRTKNKRKHELPLSRQALAIIERQPRRNSSAFLFSDVKGYRNWDAAKARLDVRLGIAPWTLHDLRRTCATGMAELDVQPHVIETTLNHASGHKAGVAGIYNRSKLIEPMRRALQLWADHLDQITSSS